MTGFDSWPRVSACRRQPGPDDARREDRSGGSAGAGRGKGEGEGKGKAKGEGQSQSQSQERVGDKVRLFLSFFPSSFSYLVSYFLRSSDQTGASMCRT